MTRQFTVKLEALDDFRRWRLLAGCHTEVFSVDIVRQEAVVITQTSETERRQWWKWMEDMQ